MLFIFPVSHTDVVNMCDVSEGKCLNKQVKKNTGCIIALYCPAWGGGGGSMLITVLERNF